MKKRLVLVITITMLLVNQLVFVIPNVFAAESSSFQIDFDKLTPQNVNISYDVTKFIIEWKNPKSIEDFSKYCYDNYYGSVRYIIDWRVNGGPWHMDKEVPQGGNSFDYYGNYNLSFYDNIYYLDNGTDSYTTKVEINKLFFGLPYDGTVSEWLKTNNVEFRVRYFHDYWDDVSYSQKYVYSPFSNSVLVGTANPTGSGAQTPLDKFGTPQSPTVAKAPEKFSAVYMTLDLRWKVPESIQAASDAGTAVAITYIDWKVNNGPWHNPMEETGDINSYYFQHMLLNRSDMDSDGYVTLSIPKSALGINEPLLTWLSSNTCYFKARYVLKTLDGELLISPYTDTIMVGKGTTAPSAPKLDKPQQVSAILTTKWDTHIIDFSWNTPNSVTNVNKSMPVKVFVDYKTPSGKWQSEQMGLSSVVWHADTLRDSYDVWFNQAEVKGTYTFRLYFGTEYVPGKWAFSGFSDTITIDFGTGKVTNPNNTVAKAEYKGASSWAVPELDKAVTYGFITNSIKGNMQAPITREEFAELVMKLYENYTNTTVVYTPPAPFTDTDNIEIYKANQLGIVLGTNAVKKLFSPDQNITREQIAAMLYRAITQMAPNGDLSTEGAEVFSDISSIYPSFIDSVKFLNKNGIMKTNNGKINPKDTATREQAVLMVVRIFEYFN